MTENVEPDYPDAATAWMVLEMTKLVLEHREKCIDVALEYERRLTEERSQDTKPNK
jgi:hypothetical protein